ncbi:MAG: hypothetical protein M1824_004687 [Vezdaea acicularis]|nr:MAG: hypothetical protein M1824_004687 [Vezdaea acicularis]
MSNYVSELEQGVESFEGGEQQQQGGQQQQGSQQQGGQQGGKQEPSTDMTDRVVNEAVDGLLTKEGIPSAMDASIDKEVDQAVEAGERNF